MHSRASGAEGAAAGSSAREDFLEEWQFHWKQNVVCLKEGDTLAAA